MDNLLHSVQTYPEWWAFAAIGIVAFAFVRAVHYFQYEDLRGLEDGVRQAIVAERRKAVWLNFYMNIVVNLFVFILGVVVALWTTLPR